MNLFIGMKKTKFLHPFDVVRSFEDKDLTVQASDLFYCHTSEMLIEVAKGAIKDRRASR